MLERVYAELQLNNLNEFKYSCMQWKCVYVCVWCNTVAVYPGLWSKQLVPICFFFYSCGLWLREWGALACGVWVWTSSREVCTAGVCVCVWVWFMASERSCVCICGFALNSCICVWTRGCIQPCVWVTRVCVWLWLAPHPACLCGVTVCARVCLVVSNKYNIFPL